MTSRRLDLAVLGSVAAVLTAAAIEAAISAVSSSGPAPRRFAAPSRPLLPACRTQQLGLALQPSGGDGGPLLVLRHLGGPACRLRRLSLRATVRDSADAVVYRGTPFVEVDGFAGELRRDSELDVPFRPWDFLCRRRGRRLVVDVRGGGIAAFYTARCRL